MIIGVPDGVRLQRESHYKEDEKLGLLGRGGAALCFLRPGSDLALETLSFQTGIDGSADVF